MCIPSNHSLKSAADLNSRTGYNERRCITRDVLGLYGCIITVATYNGSLSASGELSLEDIVKALKQCITEHNVLSTAIEDAKTERPQLTRVSQMDLLAHVYIKDALDPEGNVTQRIQPLLEQAHNEPWVDDGLPQWRVYIAPLLPISSSSWKTFHLAFASSHALADGMSGLCFHSSFLRALRGMNELEFDTDPIWNIPSNTYLLPPLDRAATFPISWSFFLRPAVNEFLPTWVTSALGLRDTQADDVWCGASTRPERSMSSELIPTAVRTAFVSHETLQRVLNVCKSHNARMTGLLNHLTARALAQALRSRGHNYSKFIAQTAMDLRKCIPNAKNCMANYNTADSENLSTPADPRQSLRSEDWEAVGRSTQRLAEASSTLVDHPVALLKYLTNIRTWMVKQVTKPADASFGMSNLGTSDADMIAGEGWSVKDMIFSQSADGLGPPLNVNVASVQGGPLALVITWWPGMLEVDDEGEFVEEICESVVNQLELIA